jgi:pentose-5-phosphate-3-epimerase
LERRKTAAVTVALSGRADVSNLNNETVIAVKPMLVFRSFRVVEPKSELVFVMTVNPPVGGHSPSAPSLSTHPSSPLAATPTIS